MGLDTDLRDLNKKRGNLRCRLTNFSKYVNSLDKASLTEEQILELQLRVTNAEQIFTEFQEIQSQIEEIANETELLSQLEVRDSIESQYFAIISLANKLDSTTCKEWENKKSTFGKDTKVTLNDLLQFLKDRSDVLDMVQAQGHKQVIEPSKKPTTSTSPSSQQIRSFISRKQSPRIGTSSTAKSSRAINKTNLICSNCLQTGHSVDECHFGSCKQCSQKHNSLIHLNNTSASCNSIHFIPKVTHTDATAHDSTSDGARANTLSLHAHSNISFHSKQAVQSMPIEQVLLSTAIVEVCDINNTYIVVRALLDSGSQRCFITDALCKYLRLPTIQSTHNITGIGNSVMRSEQSCELFMRSRINHFSTRLKCCAVFHYANGISISMLVRQIALQNRYHSIKLHNYSALGFSCVVCDFTNIAKLWITQKAASYGNRTHYTLPSHRDNLVVEY
ncbi:hypothetical protein SFRURICE_011165 [Spodoptera frugiperda]|nr:hypothetical protein SFRURICE_011165 [Spodoptera frugiperda]